MVTRKTVLVTGGAGFIGSHLVDALIIRGYRVRVLDSLAPPTHDGKLPDWFNPKAKFIKGDVCRKKDLAAALRGADYVFHLAAYMDYHLDFSTYFDVNVKSTALIYEIAVEEKLPLKKIIVASSQSVYGEGKYRCQNHGLFYPDSRLEEQLKSRHWEVVCPICHKPADILPETESDFLTPQIPYGISKQAAENLCLVLGKIYQIPSVALRYSIVHGSRQSFRHFYSGALREFCVRAITGLPMVMHEDGNQVRDFINIHDTIAAHLTVLENPKADYQVFNVGSSRATRVLDLARLVCHEAGVKFQPVLEGRYRLRTARLSVMDISKLKKLGWHPIRSLKDNVQEYLAWIKQYPDAVKYLKKTYRELERTRVLK